MPQAGDANAGAGGDGGTSGALNGGTSGASGSAGHSGGASGRGTSGTHGGGASGDGSGAKAGASSGGEPADSGAGGTSDGGSPDSGLDLEALITDGEASEVTEARSAFGAVLVANDGARVYAVESRRDVETGPFGLPWRSRFRLAAYDQGVEAWSFAAEPDDVISDVAVHPSGDVTIALLHEAPTRDAFELLRFDRAGTPLGTTPLPEPSAPASDYAEDAGAPLFRMKSDVADATVGGWVRLLPDAEGLIVALLSYIDRPASDPLSIRLAMGVETLAWRAGAYDERWGRVVEGAHAASPAAWAYDELRWMDQAIRPFLAQDDVTGDILVGRAWNNTRCAANVEVFAEFTAEDCVLRSVGPVENERLPLAVTRFDAEGERLGTIVLAPDEDAGEQVAFALAAHGGKLAVAGSVVREDSDGTKRTYPDPDGYVDYDGYIALYDAAGKRGGHRDFNLGRGDVLAALRWTPQGFVAVGSAGWDRWQGGMSISRGADPLLAWLSTDGSRSATRVIPLTNGSRHFNLHDVTLLDRSIVAHGFSDAPMTHSADGGNDAARTFGALRIELSFPALP